MAADPFVGTWKLNVAKSKFAGPALKSATLKVEAIDNGLRWIGDTVDADGKAMIDVWSGEYDGKDYPLTGNPDSDTIAAKKIDVNTFDTVWKKKGKVVGTARAVVSKDGKTLTYTSKDKNTQGQDIITVEVYDKRQD
jgi:hypothetical protein